MSGFHPLTFPYFLLAADSYDLWSWPCLCAYVAAAVAGCLIGRILYKHWGTHKKQNSE